MVKNRGHNGFAQEGALRYPGELVKPSGGQAPDRAWWRAHVIAESCRVGR